MLCAWAARVCVLGDRRRLRRSVSSVPHATSRVLLRPGSEDPQALQAADAGETPRGETPSEYTQSRSSSRRQALSHVQTFLADLAHANRTLAPELLKVVAAPSPTTSPITSPLDMPRPAEPVRPVEPAQPGASLTETDPEESERCSCWGRPAAREAASHVAPAPALNAVPPPAPPPPPPASAPVAGPSSTPCAAPPPPPPPPPSRNVRPAGVGGPR
jgi:hypothetical protein